MTQFVDYLGIDISKDSFDVVNKANKHTTYCNNSKGFSSFIKHIPGGSVCVMEVTGIYHLRLAEYLYSKGISVSVVNPLQIKRFSQMHLRRNKTDKADAQIISKYAQTQEFQLWEPSSKIIEQCKDSFQIIEQYVEFRAGLKSKLDGLKSKDTEQSLKTNVLKQIEQISKSIDELRNKVEELVKESSSVLFKNISSIVGIGKPTATLLIVATNEFKSFENAKQLISYFGLAPTEMQSGTSINGKRKISKMGNPLVRKKLYMCSLQASRYNKACRALYERLIAKGKSKKLALIAVAVKLLKIAFAIAKSGIPYDNKYVSFQPK